MLKKWLPILILMAATVSTAAAAPVKVAILPFAMHSDKDYTFLQKGIVEMLTSRLSAPGQVDIIDPVATQQALTQIQGMTGDNLALMAGARLKADFVIHGSVTSLGDSVSLDAKMLDITGRRQPLAFFKQTQSMGEVIPQINLLATDINTQVFGRPPSGAATAVAPPAAGAPAGDIHAHPEKLLQDGQIIGDLERGGSSPLAAGQEQSTMNPALTSTTGGGAPQFWKSQNLPHLVNGIDVADVNRDGQLELVVATKDKVLIYQTVQGRMRQIAQIEAPRFTLNVAVDAGDFDRNGTPEIYVTAYSTGRDTLQSYILEYSGAEFKFLHTGLRWYFRLIPTEERGLVLLGQSQLIESHPFSSPIVELEYNGVEYVAKKTLLPGGVTNVIGMTTGRIIEGREAQVLAFDDWDKLQLFEPNGKRIWKSADAFGGSQVTYQLSPDAAGKAYDTPKPVFLPVRIRVVELDKSGKATVVVAQNGDATGRKMAHQRFFDKGKIVGLKWDGLGLFPTWQTRDLSGRIQDLCIADFDNDGTMELVAAVVSQEGAIMTTEPKSAIIAYDLKLE
jgi:TolB-like protein